MAQHVYRKIDQFKQKIDAYQPLPAEILSQVRQYYRIGLTYTSNALEGNSLTETETKVVLEDGLTVAGKPLHDHYEALGHSAASSAVLDAADARGITLEQIRHLHKLFYEKIDADNAGVYRRAPVLISGSNTRFPAPSELEQKMQAFADSIPTLKKELHPVVFAARMHLDFIQCPRKRWA